MFPFPAVQCTGRQQFTTWNPADKSANIALTGANLTATGSVAQAGVRGTTSKSLASGGKWGLTFTLGGASPNFFVGIADSAETLTSAPITAGAHSVSRYVDQVWQGATNLSSGVIGTPPASSVIDVLYDLSALKFWARFNGGLWNNSGAADPASGTGGISFTSTGLGASLFPYGCDNAGSLSATLNAYASGYPAGFRPWDAT